MASIAPSLLQAVTPAKSAIRHNKKISHPRVGTAGPGRKLTEGNDLRVCIGGQVNHGDVIRFWSCANELCVAVAKRNISTRRTMVINRIGDIIPGAVIPGIAVQKQAGASRTGDVTKITAIISKVRWISVNPVRDVGASFATVGIRRRGTVSPEGEQFVTRSRILQFVPGIIRQIVQRNVSKPVAEEIRGANEILRIRTDVTVGIDDVVR